MKKIGYLIDQHRDGDTTQTDAKRMFQRYGLNLSGTGQRPGAKLTQAWQSITYFHKSTTASELC